MKEECVKVRIDLLRCSACNKRFRAIATEGKTVVCSHCSTPYQFRDGHWKWVKPERADI